MPAIQIESFGSNTVEVEVNHAPITEDLLLEEKPKSKVLEAILFASGVGLLILGSIATFTAIEKAVHLIFRIS